jgi:DNA-binding transcriptional LysR family regulator
MLGNLSDIDLRLIRVFIAVVDAGGITPAQSTLNVGQPTISTQLSALEGRLGYRLCERGRAGFRLTPKGVRFIELARQLLAHVNEFAAHARHMDRQLVGSVHIGLIGLIGLIGHLPMAEIARIGEAIARFRQRSESVRFTVSVRASNELEEQLLADELQLAIGYFWHRVPQLDDTPLFAERQFAYCGRAHALFGRADRVTAAEAAAEEWAWRGYPVPEAMAAITPSRVTAVADNMEAVAMLILSGRHLGFLPGHFAEPYVALGLLAPLVPEQLHYDATFHLVNRSRKAQDGILTALLEDVRSAYASGGALATG